MEIIDIRKGLKETYYLIITDSIHEYVYFKKFKKLPDFRCRLLDKVPEESELNKIIHYPEKYHIQIIKLKTKNG